MRKKKVEKLVKKVEKIAKSVIKDITTDYIPEGNVVSKHKPVG